MVARFFSIMSFLDQIEPLQQQAVQDFNQASDLTSLDQVRIQYLGASGKFTALLKQLSTLTKEEKPAAGKLVNLAKGELEAALASRRSVLELQAALPKNPTDFT